MKQYEIKVKKIEYGFALVKAENEVMAKNGITVDSILWNKQKIEWQEPVCIEEDVVVLAYPELESAEASQ